MGAGVDRSLPGRDDRWATGAIADELRSLGLPCAARHGGVRRGALGARSYRRAASEPAGRVEVAGVSTDPSGWRANRPWSRGCTGSSRRPGPAAELGRVGSRRRPGGSRPRCSSRTARSCATGSPIGGPAAPGTRRPRRRASSTSHVRRRAPTPVSAPTRVPPMARPLAVEHVEGADRVGRDAPAASSSGRRARGGGARSRRRRRRARPTSAAAATAASAPSELAGDDGDSSHAPAPASDRRDVLGPQHREVRLDELVLGRQVEPDLEQLERVRPVARRPAGTSRSARCPPPAVSHCTSPRAEAGGGAERVGVVDRAPAHEGDRLEATVRVLGEARAPCSPWYMRQPSMPAKSCPISRPASDASGPRSPRCPPGRRRRGATQNRNGSIVGHWNPIGTVWRTELDMAARLRAWRAPGSTRGCGRCGCSAPARRADRRVPAGHVRVNGRPAEAVRCRRRRRPGPGPRG